MAKQFAKRLEFQRLIAMGKYSQREISAKIGISEVTASRWNREIKTSGYYKIRQQMIAQLEELTTNYTANMELIRLLIADLERVERLIIKTQIKYSTTTK